MSDQTLLSFGAAATFIAASGVYIYVRALINDRPETRREPVPVRVEKGVHNLERRSSGGRAA